MAKTITLSCGHNAEAKDAVKMQGEAYNTQYCVCRECAKAEAIEETARRMLTAYAEGLVNNFVKIDLGNVVSAWLDSFALDGYWRGTNRKAEYAEVKAGKQIVSSNHLDGSREAGMSVSKSLADVWLSGFAYCYRVEGDVVGCGSDGEPVLGDVRVISALYKGEDAIAKDKAKAAKLAALKDMAEKTGVQAEIIIRLAN